MQVFDTKETDQQVPFLCTKECNALWGEPERVIEVYCRFSSTVEDGALSLSLRKTRLFAQYQDSVTGLNPVHSMASESNYYIVHSSHTFQSSRPKGLAVAFRAYQGCY